MLDQTSILGSDDWWLMRLANRLGAGFQRMGTLQKHINGDSLLPNNEWSVGTREAYERFMRRSRLHVVETISDSRTDRQSVIGFRTADNTDEDGDALAWANWTRSRMELQERDYFKWVANFGRASIILSQPQSGGVDWLVRNEWTTLTEPNALRPWLTEAGITVGHNPVLGIDTITLFRPGYYRVAYRRTSVSTIPQDGSTWSTDASWTWVSDRVHTATPDALVQTGMLDSDGFGVWEKHLDTIDRINEITLNALTLIVMQSFRQRAIKGNLPNVYPEDHPRAGEEVNYDEIFRVGPAALWMLPADAEMWESAPTDVTPIYNARKSELKTLCSLTRTPQDIFDAESVNQSAAGSDNSKEPLIFAVKAMNKRSGVLFSQLQAQTFQMLGDAERADVSQIETLFQKVNPASMAERAEAAAKFKNGGATQDYINEEVFEMSPSRRRQARLEQTSEALALAAATAAVNRGG